MSTTLLPHRPERYLRTPHLLAEGQLPAEEPSQAQAGTLAEGTLATLSVIAWEGDHECVLRFPVGVEGRVDGPGLGSPAVGAPERLFAQPAIAGLTRGDALPRPTDAPGVVDHFAGARSAVWVERRGGWSRVLCSARGATPTLVWEAWATAAAPTLAETDDGVWVAFHHNLREDDGRPDLAKWVALRFVTAGGEVLAPAASMRERDRDLDGEEQNFEFPTLCVGSDGALSLYGRGSHAFYRQRLSAEGFGPRERLGDGTWGCRGRWVAACRLGDSTELSARREKDGIALSLKESASGGRPALVEVATRHPERAHRDVPRRPTGPDPARRDGRMTLFGDIHQHSAHSDGCGSADEPYVRARHVYGDDFVALTEHESFIGKRIGPGEWEYLKSVAEGYDEPGTFATLIAYEWTGRRYPGPGHKVVYAPDANFPIISRDDVPEGADLLAEVKRHGGFAVPHHVGWTGADADAHDPLVQPVWEICSCHGCYLYADHPLGARGDLRDQMVEAVLRQGRRFGFIACSDGHGLLYHHGAARKRDPFRCGLTAVQAKARTREAILEALRERRCYATSGVPILLDVRAGEASSPDMPMGSALPDAPVALWATATGASPLLRIALVGPDGVLAEGRPSGDSAPASYSAEVQHSLARPPAWVYAKVEQRDGERAWSSPIFFG